MQSGGPSPVRWFRGVAKLAEFWPLLLLSIILISMFFFIKSGHSDGENVLRVSLDRASAVPPVQITDSSYSYADDKVLRLANCRGTVANKEP